MTWRVFEKSEWDHSRCRMVAAMVVRVPARHELLIVAHEAAVLDVPGEGPLHHPPAADDGEAPCLALRYTTSRPM
jgi:hypothetical protein